MKINKKLTLNFGIGVNKSKKIHKQLGLNFRNSPFFIKKIHKDKIENRFLKNQTGKTLKVKLTNFYNFKKKIKVNGLNQNKKMNDKKKKFFSK